MYLNFTHYQCVFTIFFGFILSLVFICERCFYLHSFTLFVSHVFSLLFLHCFNPLWIGWAWDKWADSDHLLRHVCVQWCPFSCLKALLKGSKVSTGRREALDWKRNAWRPGGKEGAAVWSWGCDASSGDPSAWCGHPVPTAGTAAVGDNVCDWHQGRCIPLPAFVSSISLLFTGCSRVGRGSPWL